MGLIQSRDCIRFIQGSESDEESGLCSIVFPY